MWSDRVSNPGPPTYESGALSTVLRSPASSSVSVYEVFMLLQITRNLVKSKIKTDDRYLHPIPLNTPVVVEGVQVTFLDANQ